MSDSQVMTQIFYHAGYDVLGDYNGGAVFVIVDYRQRGDKPLVYFWKGRSTEYSYSKVNIDIDIICNLINFIHKRVNFKKVNS